MALVYDNNGNLVTGDGKYRVYNSLNQLSKVYNGTDSSGDLLEVYTYHPTQERVLVKEVYENSALKETVYYIDENFVRVVNASGTYDYTYVKHNGQLVAQLNPGGSKIYIIGNHEGSSSVVTNQVGEVIENTTYSPYGEVVSGGSTVRYGYEGKEHDTLIGDTDFNARKFNPSLGMFTQPDTLLPNVYDPQQLNRYMFERGNPYKYVDDDGHNTNSELIDNVITRFEGYLAMSVNKQENDKRIRITEKICSSSYYPSYPEMHANDLDADEIKYLNDYEYVPDCRLYTTKKNYLFNPVITINPPSAAPSTLLRGNSGYYDNLQGKGTTNTLNAPKSTTRNSGQSYELIVVEYNNGEKLRLYVPRGKPVYIPNLQNGKK